MWIVQVQCRMVDDGLVPAESTMSHAESKHPLKFFSKVAGNLMLESRVQ